jgi:cell division protein FtsB
MSTHTPSLPRTRVGAPVLSGALMRRIVWNVIPVVLVVGALEMVLLGDDGLLERHNVKNRLYTTRAKADEIQVHNAVLRARIRQLQTDPVAVRRSAAERLLLAPTGSTIYRFEEPLNAP